MKVVPKNQSTFIAIRLKRDISGSRGDYLIVNEAAENVDIVSNAVFFENFAVEAEKEIALSDFVPKRRKRRGYTKRVPSISVGGYGGQLVRFVTYIASYRHHRKEWPLTGTWTELMKIISVDADRSQISARAADAIESSLAVRENGRFVLTAEGENLVINHGATAFTVNGAEPPSF